MSRCCRQHVMAIMAGLIVCLALSISGCAKKDEISGTWKGRITLPQTGKSLADLEFILTRQGDKVSGMMIFTKPGSKLPLSGKIEAGKLSLSSPMKNGLAVSISADWQSPKMIKGTAVLDYEIPQQGKKQDTTTLELTR